MLKQEFLEFRISEAEGLHKGYDRVQKILSQLNQLKAKPEDKDINLKFLRAFPLSWSQVALTLKTKGGLELLSFDDLYYKLKTLDVDVKGYTTFSSSQSTGPSHSAFIEKLDLEEMDLKWQMAMLSVRVHKFKQKDGRKIKFDKKESTRIYNLITGADTEEASTASDAGEFALMGVTSEVHYCPFGCEN
nr:hypothetical protein [Tanacetum cinerariifolium]